ncbi:MAG: GNAT family N-acetyltransferase, partial [Gemmatimonadales bacterium]
MRSWRQNYRGAFSDAFLDGDLPGERLRVWRERLDHPPGNQFVQLAIDGANLVGFVCAYGAHDPEWGSLVDNLHV